MELPREAASRRRVAVAVVGAVASLAGCVVVAASASAQLGGDATRLSGASRFDTAVAISAAAWPQADTVFLASGETFPDALALAASTRGRGPILLTQRAALPAVVGDEIARLGACELIVVGGAQAVSDAVMQAAQARLAGPCEGEPTPPPESEPTPPEGEPGTSRTNPVPLGQAGRVADWDVSVAAVDDDATDEVLAENPFNEPPAAGSQFVIVRVRGTYAGGDSDHLWLHSFNAVGDAAVTYQDRGCGVIPDPLDDAGEAFPGGTVEGNVCFEVPSTQVASLVMFVERSLEDRTFFALR